jgi:hypothetical protein
VYFDTARAIARAERRAALGGRRTRGIEDVILCIENTLPGFGGMYMDDTKTIVVYGPATVSADTVRTVLAQLAPTLDVDSDTRGRLLAQRVRVVTAHFPFSMLVAWETMFGKYVPHDLGVASMDADEQTNTVHIGIMSTAMMTKTLQFAHDIGIPLSAMTVTQQNRAFF